MDFVSYIPVLFQTDILVLLVAGTFFGIVIGILPGLGGAIALALLIPLTIGLSKEGAIALLLGAYGASTFGGAVTSILINTPGDPTNAATCLDGYPLAKQGKAMMAITAALICSALGGFAGLIALAALVPVARSLVLMFSYPDFFMLAVFGLLVIARLARGNLLLGLISALAGLLLAFVGTDPIMGSERFTFGIDYLWDGINLIPVLIGLFAISEALLLSTKEKSISSEVINRVRFDGMLEGVVAVGRNFWLFLRSCFIGVYVGMIPGVGGVVASLMSYGVAVQSSRHPERFGHGAIEGVIASESANDAKEGGSLLPTLAFGIPGSAGMAVLLGGLTLHGVAPGAQLITQDQGTVNLIIAAAVVGKFVALILAFIAGVRLMFLTRIPGQLLAPGIIVIALTGAYSYQGKFEDMVLAMAFGLVGVIMEKYRFSRIALVIALVLGGLVESSYHSTMTVFGVSGFFTRPIAIVLLLLCAITLLSPLFKGWWQRRRGTVQQ